MFSKFWVHAWMEGLNVDNCISVIGGQTHCGMPRGAKMSLALNQPKEVALLNIQSQTLPPSMHHKWKNNQLKIIGNRLPTKCPIELKDDFNVLYAIQEYSIYIFA